MKTRLIKIGLRIVVSVVFIAAGFEKVLDPEAFAIAIKNYHMVPNGLVNIMALGIPMTELGVGICLFFGIKPRIMGWVICLLLLVFLGAISHALWRGEPMNCGCFLGEETSIASMWISFLRNWVLLIATLFIISIHAGKRQEVLSSGMLPR
jgi:uncharacterized membrane protein YphA (DoxX/SURF4 family)